MQVGDPTYSFDKAVELWALGGYSEATRGFKRAFVMQSVSAFVLAGGRNEGFGVLTRNRAKAALPFAGHYRLIDFALSSLADSGVPRVGVIIQYLPGSLLDHVGTGLSWDYNGLQRRLKVMPPFVGVRDTQWYQGSADALRKNLNFSHPERHGDIIICSGEHVYAMDFADAVRFHREKQADLTIVAVEETSDKPSHRFGRVEFDPENKRVRRFVEKPSEIFSEWISNGMYIFKADVLVRAMGGFEGELLPMNLPKDVVEPLAAQGHTFAYPYRGLWHYLQDLGEYYESHQALLRGDQSILPVIQDTRTNLMDRRLGSRAPACFGANSEVSGSIVSPGCIIHGRVINSVLSPGVYVAAGAEVHDSILLHDTRVEAGTIVNRTISDKDVVISPGCGIGVDAGRNQPNMELPGNAQDLTILGKGCLIGAGVQISRGVQVYSSAMIEAGDPALKAGQQNLATGAEVSTLLPQAE